MKPVRKAVLPVAGLGPGSCRRPRSRRKTSSMSSTGRSWPMWWPRRRAAGIEHFIFVVGRGQGAIEDYFDHAFELETHLQAKGKRRDPRRYEGRSAEARRDELRAPDEPLGLGHAVWCARDMIGDEPFAVMLPDMLMDATPPPWPRRRRLRRRGRQHRRRGAGPARRGAQIRHRRPGRRRRRVRRPAASG